MKYKEYLEKHKKIIDPLNKKLPLIMVLGILESVSEEMDIGFKSRCRRFIKDELDIIQNSEIKEETEENNEDQEDDNDEESEEGFLMEFLICEECGKMIGCEYGSCPPKSCKEHN